MGVWNGWGYGIACFRALNFQISEPAKKQLAFLDLHQLELDAIFGSSLAESLIERSLQLVSLAW